MYVQNPECNCSKKNMTIVRRSATIRQPKSNSSAMKIATVIVVTLCMISYSLISETGQGAVVSSQSKPPNNDNKSRLEFVHITKTGGSAIEKAGAKEEIIWGACHYMNISDVGCSNPDLNYVSPDYQSYAKTSPWHTPPKILKTQYSISESPYRGADLFAVVRNPYDRVISEYYCPWTGFQPKFRKNTKHEKDPNDPKIMNYWVKNMVTKLDESLTQYMSMKPDDRPKNQSKGVNEDPYNLAQKHYVNQAEYVFDGDNQIVKNVVHYEDLSQEFEKLMDNYGLDIKLPPKGTSGTYTNNKKKLTYLDLDEESIAVINKYAVKDFELLGYEMVQKFDKNGNYSLEAKTI
jgi:hypothetical protein